VFVYLKTNTSKLAEALVLGIDLKGRTMYIEVILRIWGLWRCKSQAKCCGKRKTQSVEWLMVKCKTAFLKLMRTAAGGKIMQIT